MQTDSDKMTNRLLTSGEIALARSVFGETVDYTSVRLHRRKWFPFHPRRAVMAPDGDIWFHPKGPFWRDDFAEAPLPLQGLFIHEMTHVWQAQTRGRWYLVLMRHPFCRYRYTWRPGWPLERYGLEQQAEIVRHAFLQRRGHTALDAALTDQIESVLPFSEK